jgi:hypothetical protein
MCNAAFAAAAAIATTAAMAAPMQEAKAMDVKQCFERAVLLQKLQEEGQQYIAFANEPLVDKDKSEARLFTGNKAGTVGYIIGGDQPKEVGSTQGCVELRLKDVEIFDARVPGVDPKALIKTEDPAKALLQCDKSGRGRCDVHSRSLASQDRDGYRVMMQAHIAELQPDGSYATGDLVTITGHLEKQKLTGRLEGMEKLGTWAITSTAGAYTIARAFTDMTYAPYALKILDERH